MQAWKYMIGYLVPLATLIGIYSGGIYTYLAVLLVFGLIPLLDFVIGLDQSNPTARDIATMQHKLSFKLILYLYVPVQIIMIVAGARFTASESSLPEKLGVILAVGLSAGGLGITIAHELGHKKRLIDSVLGKFLLMTVSYMHFHIEHNLGHHKKVATPEDPASARLGESFYRFYPRTLFGSFRNAWRLEKERLRAKEFTVWSRHNQMLWFSGLPILFGLSLGYFWGWQASVFFFLQSLVAFSLLEVINYVEHYGLERKQVSPGKFERVGAQHAWNASERLTNYILFKLQRHPDHHMHAAKEYQLLEHFNDSPQLPTGYAGMILLALFPPLWHKVMDKRVLEFQHAFTAEMTG